MGGKKNNIPPRDPACEGCAYARMAGHWPICAYILAEGRRRPCPAGADCTVKRTEGVVAMSKQADWDKERARILMAEGKKDLEIADAVGCSLSAFRSWKQREGLVKKREEKRPADAPPAAGTGVGDDGRVGLEPAPTDQIAPVGRGIPVGLSLCLGGCAVTIEAPDLVRAVRVLELLQKID